MLSFKEAMLKQDSNSPKRVCFVCLQSLLKLQSACDYRQSSQTCPFYIQVSTKSDVLCNYYSTARLC